MAKSDWQAWREQCAAWRKQLEADGAKYAGDPFLGPVPDDYAPEPEPGNRAVPEAERQTPAEQRGLAAVLIDVAAANGIIPCPMGECIACRERDAAWEAIYRLLEPKYQAMVQRFLVFAELFPPGMSEEDR